jgi:hypothetical protein
MKQKQLQHKENNTRLYPRNNSKTKSKRIRAKLPQSPTQVKEMAQAQNVNILHAKQSNAPFPFL